jgi:hypothetical protein
MTGKKGSKSPKKARATKAPRGDVVVAFPKEAVKRLPATTIDASWVRFRLRNGYGAALAVVKSDWNRVWSMAQGLGDRKTFATFETSTRRVAINLRWATAVQFDGIPSEGLIAESLPDTKTLDIMFIDSPEWLHIEVEPDGLSMRELEDQEAEMDEMEAREAVQCGHLNFMCDSSDEGSDYVEMVQDVRGSSIWLRLNDIAIVSMPLNFVRDD